MLIRLSTRCALLLSCLTLNSCSLISMPYTLLSGMLGAVGRTLGTGADNTDYGRRKPLHLDQREIEKAGGALDTAPHETPVAEVNVASTHDD